MLFVGASMRLRFSLSLASCFVISVLPTVVSLTVRFPGSLCFQVSLFAPRYQFLFDFFSLRLLVADVSDIKYVINYDYPNSSEDYVHRIGRTARANRTGTAYTFFTDVNARQARDLIHVMDEAGQKVSPKLRDLAARSREAAGSRKCS